MKHVSIFALCLSSLLVAPFARASPSTVVEGLEAPVKVVLTDRGLLLVAEAGAGPNTGRISIVDPATGERRTLVEGLPSGFAPPSMDPSGPSGLFLRGRSLFVTIGNGDATLSGPMGAELANPSPSSPILSSVLEIRFSARAEATTSGVALTPDDHEVLALGRDETFVDSEGNAITVHLVADFPDYVPRTWPGVPDAVRPSNPFGVVHHGGVLYVADASMNLVQGVDPATGAFAPVTTFGPLPNTRGFGPPVIEPVPDSVRIFGNDLLVSLLGGFPFPPGEAQIRVVDLEAGENAPFLVGLTSAIDVLPLRGARGRDSFLTLEFSTDQLDPAALGRLMLYRRPDEAPTALENELVTPTSLARDPRTGAIYVTEIFTGRLVRVDCGHRCGDGGFF